MGEGLTGKMARFCEEYLIDCNATAAYRRAGYKGKGNVAEAAACRMIATPKIQKRIQERQKQLQIKTGITQERVLAEYAKLAFYDPRKFFDDKGELVPVHLLDDDTAASLAGMDVMEATADAPGRTRKIKISDKKGALDSIARTLGMFNDKLGVSGEVNVHMIDYGSLHKPKNGN